MMGYKKYLLLIISLVSYFAFTSSVDAALCDREHINQLKELANQVEVNYEYIDYSEEILGGNGGAYATNRYKLTINLIAEDLYLVYNNKEYYYNQTDNGIVSFSVNSGYVEFTIHTKTCAGHKLRTINLTLPKFNTYSYRGECQELEEYELDVCDPWYQGTITDSSFNKVIDEYLNPVVKEASKWDEILIFLSNYYLYIIGGIVAVVLLVVAVIIHGKRSVLE